MNFLVRQTKSTTSICHKFNSEHPQYNTHSLYEFKAQKILVLQSYTISSQKNDLQKCPSHLYFVYIMAYNF